MKKIKVINGPNLNLLGKREPVLYGSEDFSSIFARLQSTFPDSELLYFQSNSEAEIIAALQESGGEGVTGIVLNPAAYSHSSIAIADAVAGIDIPVVEVHISNIYAREEYRQRSYISKFANGIISGFGVEGYRLAIDYLERS